MGLCLEQDLRWLVKRARDQRIPLNGTLALTYRCGFKCAHCYATPAAVQTPELDTQQWLSIAQKLVDAGVLFLLLSGGDPLIRKDFSQIYRFLCEHGVRVSLFTNAFSITDEHIALFEDLPPHSVEASIYGATEETHARVTGVSGGLVKVVRGMERLAEAGVRVKTKSVLLTLNKHEFPQIKELCHKLTGTFRCDSMMIPDFAGGTGGVSYRVSPEEAIEMEFKVLPEALQEWEHERERCATIPSSDSLYRCGAGRSTFYVDPAGNLQPCLSATYCKVNLLQCSFSEAWKSFELNIHEIPCREDSPCRGCEARFACANCPAVARLEIGDEFGYSQYACDVAHARVAYLEQRRKGSKESIDEKRKQKREIPEASDSGDQA